MPFFSASLSLVSYVLLVMTSQSASAQSEYSPLCCLPAPPASAASKLIPDLKLLISYSQKLAEAEVPCKKDPHVVRFRKNGKELVYAAADHSYGPESENQTFQVIRGLFKNFKPQIAIVESFKNAEGTDPAGRMKDIQLCKANDFRDCPEIHFTASMALQSKVPFLGSEPTEFEIMAGLSPQFSGQDYACYTWFILLNFERDLVQTPQGSSASTTAVPSTTEVRRQNAAQHIKKNLGVEMNYEQFLKCHRDKAGSKPELTKISSEDFRPDNSPNASFYQKIGWRANQMRNPSMVKTIASALRTNDRVLVVLGSGHLVEQLQVLREMLGAPEFDCSPEPR